MAEFKLQWGVIRYRPGRGLPSDDAAAFDGWYAQQGDAEGVYELWCQQYPGWIVALVKQDKARFPA